MKRFIKYSLLVLSFTFFNVTMAQNIVDQIDENAPEENLRPDLSFETIQKVSGSKKIFILTNNNNSFGKGDFISLVKDNKLVTRALVAKTVDAIAGIKILKIYSLAKWNTLKKGMSVQVIRGDDSYFRMKKPTKDSAENFKIQEEEDLFNEETLLKDDLEIGDNKNRLIKQDNLISVYLGKIEAQDETGNSARYSQINGAWAYQVEDNIWAELSYGQNVVNDFPSTGLDTKLTNLTVKGKYSIKAPFFSVIQPYLGYQMINADSPGAGEQDATSPVTEDQLQAELDAVESIKKNRIVFGLTVLKRLVPGWFARVDLGSDILGLGFSLEF